VRTLAFALMIVSGACAPGRDAPAPTAATDEAATVTTAGDPMRHLALGDSYTIGESVGPDERWPEVLAELLAGAGVPVEPDVVARTGWTTAELDAAIDAADPRGPYDLVTLMVGVNDQFRGLDPAGFAERFGSLLDRSVDLAGGDAGRVIVLTIPDWSVTPFGGSYDRSSVAEAIDVFNGLIRQEAAERGSVVVDVTPLSRCRPDLVASDGLHPSVEMHRLWAELVLPAALQALGR
jgi:lysophospholipase L1-like esterase